MTKPATRGRPVWRIVQSLAPTPRRIVITVVAAAVAFVAGELGMTTLSPLAVLAVGALWVIGMHSRPLPDIGPSPEQLRRLDRAREREVQDEYEASGEGQRAFEQLLAAVLELTGQEVTIIVGAGRGWRPLARVTGRLRGARNIRVADEPERLGISIGTGDVIFLDRERFVRGLATYQRTADGGLLIEDVDGDALRLSAQGAAHRS